MSFIKTTMMNVVYDNSYVTVYDDDVEFPNGTVGKYFRYRWKAPHGVAIVPVTEDGFVLLIKTHKYGNDELTLEIPQGFGTDNSSPESDARRELFEETGYRADSLQPLLTLGSDFQTHVFRTAVLRENTPTTSNAEDKEVIEGYFWLKIDDVTPTKLQELRIVDSASFAALLALRNEQSSRYRGTPS
jgi:ADP-ribose pyrophosphatase